MAKYGVNKVILVGNLGKDPEVKHLEQDVTVARFTLATTESYRSKEGRTEDRTDWHNIVMWRGLAETAARYLKKGSTIYAEGRLSSRSYVGADGQKKYFTEVEVEKMVMLDGKPTGTREPGAHNVFSNIPSILESKDDPNDEVPF